MVEIGHASMRMNPEGKVDAKYVVYWRQEDGHWKWSCEIFDALRGAAGPVFPEMGGRESSAAATRQATRCDGLSTCSHYAAWVSQSFASSADGPYIPGMATSLSRRNTPNWAR